MGRDKSDEELMTLYVGGELSAFDELYRRHAGRLLGYFRHKAHYLAAEDLVQQTFMKLHHARFHYKSQFPLLPWLFTIARNLLIDEIRRRQTEYKNVVESDNIDGLADNSPHHHQDQEVSKKLTNAPLAPQQKQAIELRYLQDWSFEQIAEHLSTSEANIRQLISRGLKKLRLRWKED